MRVLPASDRALLVQARDADEALRWSLAWAGIAGVVELVPAAQTVLVRFDPLRVTARRLAAALAAAPVAVGVVPPVAEVVVDVRYDGDDLADVADMLHVSTDEVIARHVAARWQVAFCGFAPGFGYAIGSDPLFDVPRRSTPRTRVPAGSVGLAGRFTGVYPRPSPGGWQLIGRTDAVLWVVDRDPPALLAPGTLVRFRRAARPVARAVDAGGAVGAGDGGAAAGGAVGADAGAVDAGGRSGGGAGGVGGAVGAGTAAAAGRPGDGPAAPGAGDGPADAAAGVGGIEVAAASLPVLVEDLGRPGLARLGVSASGAADRTALRDANRAVGNAPGAAALEAVGAVRLRFHDAGVAVVTGAVGDAGIAGDDDRDRRVSSGIPFAVAPGDELTLGAPARGLRYVIGVRGGVRARAELGSMAADTLAGLGPRPLMPGDRVGVGDPRRAPDAVAPDPLPRTLPAPGDTVRLRVMLGPRHDWFAPAAVDDLFAQEWDVTARSDRVGIRLHGARPLRRAVVQELPSEGAVTGAVQVPADGQPVLFLPDHPLTGGYPVIGAVIDADLDLAAQLPPGARVRFRGVDGPLSPTAR